jgi:hypothetical protein
MNSKQTDQVMQWDNTALFNGYAGVLKGSVLDFVRKSSDVEYIEACVFLFDLLLISPNINLGLAIPFIRLTMKLLLLRAWSPVLRPSPSPLVQPAALVSLFMALTLVSAVFYMGLNCLLTETLDRYLYCPLYLRRSCVVGCYLWRIC